MFGCNVQISQQSYWVKLLSICKFAPGEENTFFFPFVLFMLMAKYDRAVLWALFQ